jgi:hypothetical protein
MANIGLRTDAAEKILCIYSGGDAAGYIFEETRMETLHLNCALGPDKLTEMTE